MAAEVIKNPTDFKFRVDPDGVPQEVDLCAYVTAVRIEGSQDEIDTSTFCRSSTQLGQVRWSVVASFLWEEALYDALEAHVGKEVEWVLIPPIMKEGATNAIVWRGRYGFVPFGNFEINNRVESELPIGVTVEPSKTTVPV